VLRVLCWTNIFISVNLDAFRQYHHVHNAYDSSNRCITDTHDIEEGLDKLLTSSCVVDPRSVDVL
jgi:hypothetical protein